MSEINITPMVDVMLVLLIIFMVAAPLMTSGVPVDLPQGQSRDTAATGQQREPLIVSVSKDGKIFLGQEDKNAVAMGELAAKLKAIAQARGGTDDTIFVRGDRAAVYGIVAGVMSEMRAAGFHKLSLVMVGSGG